MHAFETIINPVLETWTEQGVPYTESRSRMAERDDDECRIAGLLAFSYIPEALRGELFTAAEQLSTVAVLNVYEPRLRQSIREKRPDITARDMDIALELVALIIEGWGRGEAEDEVL